MKKFISSLHLSLSITTLVAVIAEFFFAGAGVFHATTFALHKTTGEWITYASFLLLVLSLVGVLGRTRILLSFVLVVLMIVQNLLARAPMPWVAALHPVNGLAIMGVTAALMRIGLPKKDKA